jgi:hypothetical protein
VCKLLTGKLVKRNVVFYFKMLSKHLLRETMKAMADLIMAAYGPRFFGGNSGLTSRAANCSTANLFVRE